MKRMLIVDDDLHLRKLVLTYAQLDDFECWEAENAEQALKLRQTLIARLLGKYMVEIVNVGMVDDKAEKNSFLILYSSRRLRNARTRINTGFFF